MLGLTVVCMLYSFGPFKSSLICMCDTECLKSRDLSYWLPSCPVTLESMRLATHNLWILGG